MRKHSASHSALFSSLVGDTPAANLSNRRCGFVKLVARAAVFMLLAGVLGVAQTTSTLSGTLKDPTGAVVSKAIVTLVDTKSNAQRQTPTSDSGIYTFTGVAPG